MESSTTYPDSRMATGELGSPYILCGRPCQSLLTFENTDSRKVGNVLFGLYTSFRGEHIHIFFYLSEHTHSAKSDDNYLIVTSPETMNNDILLL